MDNIISAFSAVKTLPLFIIVKFIKENNKILKVPVNCFGVTVNALDPFNRYDLKKALGYIKTLGIDYGLGFVFTQEQPFWFLDIDKCLQENKTWSPACTFLLNKFSEAYQEISISQTGIHIIGRGTPPPHICKNAALKLEFYTDKRFVALTGYHARGSLEKDYTEEVTKLVNEIFPLKSHDTSKVDPSVTTWTHIAVPQWRGPTDDYTLIERALRSESNAKRFGSSVASFRDLWENNVEVLSSIYPPNDTDLYNRSNADAALAQHLAFWTGNNCQRIKRIMLESALLRDKWERDDYLTRTIESAVKKQQVVLQDKELVRPADIQNMGQITPRDTATFLNFEQQQQLFKGCVYVQDENQILIPSGYLLNQDRFNIEYGGFTFTIDSQNAKPTKKAWEAFTQSQIINTPKVHTTCFKPQELPGVIIVTEGVKAVNTYYPVPVLKIKGDISLFNTHMIKLFPDDEDRAKLLAYLCSLVQNLGFKFRWCPVIQGIQGNGKSLIKVIIAKAIGMKYSFFVRGQELSNRFNAFQYNKIFIGVDDIYLAKQPEIIEILKPMIDGRNQEIERKGIDKVMKEICCNFLINTNHKDGLPKLENERRFAHFFTPQQQEDHLERDGLTASYFIEFTNWLDNDYGYAKVAEYFHTAEIPIEFDPARNAIRAPKTTSNNEAVEEGRSDIEHEVLEAIAQERLGFKKGWVSSIMLDRLLEEKRMSHKAPRRQRKKILEKLGYIQHPGLTEGRARIQVLPDAGRPSLYIIKNHISIKANSSEQIEKVYVEDQQ